MRWLIIPAILLGSTASAVAEEARWWNPRWQYRTTVTSPTPDRETGRSVVEVAVDFARLLDRAGIDGRFDPASLRVVERDAAGNTAETPFACRKEFNARENRQQAYLAWYAQARVGQCSSYDIYFDTEQSRAGSAKYSADLLPPENLLKNASFEEADQGLPLAWQATRPAMVQLGRFANTSGGQSLEIVVDDKTPADANREVTVSQKIDVRPFAGQEMVFQCDLLAQRAAYGAPVSIQLQQARADGSAISEYAVDPRWLTIELAQGQLVQFCERGRFNPEAATVDVRVLFRCRVTDEDTGKMLTGPESFFTVFMDNVVMRPGRRWSWPAASHGGFVEGALERAPLNRGFAFTGQRRLVFNGASEGTLTTGAADPGPQSVHWGLQAGTLEFWCRPTWDANDGAEHVFWEGVAYGHRRQSVLHKLGGRGKNELEFAVADSDGRLHTVRGRAPFKAGQWHHIAATWDFPKAQLQLFVDGRRIADCGPGPGAWPFSLTAAGSGKLRGMGIGETDQRSMPMQAFVGGQRDGRADSSAEAALDEFRVSDVVRYSDQFSPLRNEFAVDAHTRALFHFEGERDGVHAGDDRFVRGHLCVELPPQEESAPLEVLNRGKVERRAIVVRPHAAPTLFEANRAERRLTVTRPLDKLPDPRFVEYRERTEERSLAPNNGEFKLSVGGDFEPWMGSITYERPAGSPAATTRIPHWRVGDNVVPLSVETLHATAAAKASNDAEKAFETFKYALAATNYYDAGYSEITPIGRRARVSYTLTKALNIYPFDQCGPLNHTLRKLFLAVGISSNDSSGTHHQFEQAFYQGEWRLFDLSPRQYWLSRDNVTVISRREMEEDPYLKIRQGGDVCAWLRGRRTATRFGSATRPHNMELSLRPGERAALCWHNEGRWFEANNDGQPLPLAKIPPMFGNSTIVYEPSEGEAAVMENLRIGQASDLTCLLRAESRDKPATLVYRVASPYIISDSVVGGVYYAREPGAVRLSLSFDEGRKWTEVWRSPAAKGSIDAELRQHVTARYAYWLKLELAAGQDAGVEGLQVRSTLVASPLAFPGQLSRGENRITLDGPKPAMSLRSVCRWTERYKSDLGVTLNTLSFYTAGDQMHRNMLVVPPDGEATLRATLEGRPIDGEARIEGLPDKWTCRPARKAVRLTDAMSRASVEFVVRAGGAQPGEIRSFTLVVKEGRQERRVPVQTLVSQAPLVREAEQADSISGGAAVRDMVEISGARGVEFTGDGRLAFDVTASSEGPHALWFRARWSADADTNMSLVVDDQRPRSLSPMAMIGFTDWTDARHAHTKMFAHFGEQYGHWAWYRLPDVVLAPGKHRLTLSAGKGACLDAVLLLPQDSVVDRAAMNLLQNWNYAPWRNPF